MYKIIGADGREYGPVTAEQLRQWIAEGRANAQTPTLADGATEWKPLGALPEFAGHFAPPIPPVIGPLKPGTSTAGQLPKTNSFATAGLIFGILSRCVLLLLRMSVQPARAGLFAHRPVANQPASRTLRRPRPGHCRTDSFGCEPGFGIRAGLAQSCASPGKPSSGISKPFEPEPCAPNHNPRRRKSAAPQSLDIFRGCRAGGGGPGSGAVLFFFNPAQHGFYPICLFHALTGLNCPGCGGTRAAYQLLHGHLLRALQDNALFVLSLAALAARAHGLPCKKSETGRSRFLCRP